MSADVHGDTPPVVNWQDRTLGGGLVLAILLWTVFICIDFGFPNLGTWSRMLLGAAETVSTIFAVMAVGYGSRRNTDLGMAAIAAQVEQLSQKFEDREAAWNAISKLTDEYANNGSVVSLRSRRPKED